MSPPSFIFFVQYNSIGFFFLILKTWVHIPSIRHKKCHNPSTLFFSHSTIIFFFSLLSLENYTQGENTMKAAKFTKLLHKVYSYHTQEEWTAQRAHPSIRPIDLLLLCVEDVVFASELYETLHTKEEEESLVQSADSQLTEQEWQKMVTKYADHVTLLDKFSAAVAEVHDIRYSGVMVNILYAIRDGAVSADQEKLLLVVDSLINARATLSEQAVLLSSVLLCGEGKIPTLCQLPQQPTVTDIRNILIKSILEVFPLQLLKASLHQLTEEEFTQLCQNETLIACAYRQGKCMVDAYVKTTSKERRFIVEQMLWSQLTCMTQLPIQQIRDINTKHLPTRLEQLQRHACQLVDGPSVAHYIFTKLSTDVSEEMAHRLDSFWRFRMALCSMN